MGLELIALQRQKALKNTDQMIQMEPMTCRSEHAPGGVPTMVVNDYAGSLTPRGDLRFIASMLAPTVTGIYCRGYKKAHWPSLAQWAF
ncbi:hypothetical protein F6476_17920 [Pseudomonas umsongensis]|nr:hypothetical protein F6476_17920 [Pseudomonas umsongensis]